MNNTTIKISNAICRSFKNLSEDAADALLTLQVIILALYYAKFEDGILSSEFDLSDVHKLGLGIQYSEDQLESLVNTRGCLSSSVEIRLEHNIPIKLIKGAICYGARMLIYFDPEPHDIIFPSDNYSTFKISDLFGYRSAGALSLYLLLVSEQNIACVHSGYSHFYEWDFSQTCRILSLRYPAQRRPGRIFWDRFMDKVSPELKNKNPGLHLSYDVSKGGASHKLKNIEMQIAGLKTEGVCGLSAVEVLANNRPWFADNIGEVICDLTINDRSIFHNIDALGRCVSATAILTRDSLIPTGNLRGVKSITPLGYDKIKHLKGKDKKCKIIKAHIIARRFSGPDSECNLIAGTTALNTEMLKIENSIAKYLQNEAGTAVLYRIEPIYEGAEVVPSKVRIGAINLDQRDHKLSISVEILNAEAGICIDYCGESPAV